MRIEEKLGIKEDISVEQGIKEKAAAAERPLEIVTALKMLNNKRKEG